MHRGDDEGYSEALAWQAHDDAMGRVDMAERTHDRLMTELHDLKASRDRLRELVRAQAAYATLMYQVPPPSPMMRVQAADRMQAAQVAVSKHNDLGDDDADTDG